MTASPPTDLLNTLPGELIAAGGVTIAALLTLIGVVVGHIVAARTARRAAGLVHETSLGQLALDLAKQAGADVTSTRGEVTELRREVRDERARFGTAYVHASALHYRWPGAAVDDRPDWPATLPAPTPTERTLP